MTTTTTTNGTVRVHVIANDHTGEIDIHAEGCADVRRRPQYQTSRFLGYALRVDEVADLREVVEMTYGPEAGSYYAEAGIDEADYAEAWQEFVGNFVVKPCVRGLVRDSRSAGTAPTSFTCEACGRVFDLFDARDSFELVGHDESCGAVRA